MVMNTTSEKPKRIEIWVRARKDGKWVFSKSFSIYSVELDPRTEALKIFNFIKEKVKELMK